MSPIQLAEGFAPGKLILSGEHAVVYGYPAVAIAVQRGTRVRLERAPGPTALGHSPVQDPRLDRALAALLPARGLRVHIHSDLPVGRGMGSSAALAVALVRAAAALDGRSADFAECHARGFIAERIFHGAPSGVDHAVSAMGGGVAYTKRAHGPDIAALPLPPLQLVVLDSGTAGDTAAMVAGVGERRPGIDGVLREIGALTERVQRALRAPEYDPFTLGALFTRNHTLLQQIGVSTPALDALVALALAHGAHGAKLAGAGGGGVVIALVTQAQPLLAAAAAHGVPAFAVGAAPSTR